MSLKPELIVAGTAVIMMSILGWSLNSQFDSIMLQMNRQWEKIDQIEMFICSQHPKACEKF